MTFESQNKKTSPQTTAQGPRPGSYSCTTRAGLLDVKCPVQGKGKSLTDQQKIKQYLYCFGVLYRWIFLDRNRTYTVLLLLYERWYPVGVGVTNPGGLGLGLGWGWGLVGRYRPETNQTHQLSQGAAAHSAGEAPRTGLTTQNTDPAFSHDSK